MNSLSCRRSSAVPPADGRRIDPALRARYDVRGPRYTSYPPANHFREIDLDELAARWRARNGLPGDPGLSLYFHIPFCRSRCLFCGCHTYVGREPAVLDGYVSAMTREMEITARIIDPARPVRQVAMGGGTPNHLQPSQAAELLGAMRRTWRVEAGAELSVEIDPRTSTPAILDVLLDHGFNRFSLGVQDFSPRVLAAVQRNQGLMEVEGVVEHLRRRGCGAINFDLIYGLPGQGMESAAATARQTLAFGPSRVALYSYAHVPWIHPHQQVLERQGLPDPDLKAAIFHAMSDLFLEAGYVPVGMDHFARPEDELTRAQAAGTLRRTFMGYTTGRGLDVLGFGASAISAVGASYSQDDKALDGYAEALREERLPVVRGFLLSPDDEIRRELILDLSCNFRVDLAPLARRFGIEAEAFFVEELQRLEPLAADGLLHRRGTLLEVSEIGRFFIRNICMVFDRYLEGEAASRAYSRTV